MKNFTEDIQKLYGQEAWGARKGTGTHIQIEFGSQRQGEPYPFGEYSLWVSGAPWRLERNGRIASGSGQDDLSTNDLACLNSDRVLAVEAEAPYFDVIIFWASGYKLSIFCENKRSDLDTLVYYVPHGAYGLDSSGSVSYEKS
jgi:hypothetical protein